jgi:hypothetical protein
LDKKRALLRYNPSGRRGLTLPQVAVLDGLLLFAGWGCGKALAPGETEVGSAGEQPTKG